MPSTQLEMETAIRETSRVLAVRGAILPSTLADITLGEGTIDDREFDGLDRHRVVVDAEHARAFAGRRAQRAGELIEVNCDAEDQITDP